MRRYFIADCASTLYPCLYVNIQAEGRGEWDIGPFGRPIRLREARRNVKGEAGGEGECAGEDEGSEEVRYSGERGSC